MHQAPMSDPPAGALLVTGDPDLRAEALRLCAAAGLTPEVLDTVEAARAGWRAAGSVLLGEDAAVAAAGMALPRRDDVVVVTRHTETDTLWRAAVAVGAAEVLRLPLDQERLVGRLTDAVEGAGGADVIAVLGARGGAGASVVAASLALRAARRRRTCLIDTDPLSGGIELLLGSEDEEGLRWPDVAVTHGRIGAAAFRAALPQHRGVTVLSWSRGVAVPVEPATMRTVLAAAVRSFEVVVLDLPRQRDAASVEALAVTRHLLLVATSDVRATASAAAMLPALQAQGARVQLVVRTTGSASPSPEMMAASLGLRLAGVVPTRRSVARSVDNGFGPPRRGVVATRCDAILDSLADREQRS